MKLFIVMKYRGNFSLIKVFSKIVKMPSIILIFLFHKNLKMKNL